MIIFGGKVCDLSIITNLKPFFVCWIFIFIAQGEYSGQTRYAKVLDGKSLIDRCYRSGHRLELRNFFFTQFLLDAEMII